MKRTAYLTSLLVFASFAAQAVAAAPPVEEPLKKKASVVVRDHRTGGVKEPLKIVDPVQAPPIVRDHRDKGKPVVRDHRGESNVIVRDHRGEGVPVVRDHRDKGTVVVRDHRGEGTVVVRDHRGEGTVMPPPTGTRPPTTRPPRPTNVAPTDPTPPATADPTPDDPQPEGPQDPPKEDRPKHHFPWKQFLNYGLGAYPRTVVVERPVYVPMPVVVATATAPVAQVAPVAPALVKLCPGMEVRIAGQKFGAAVGRGAVKIGDLILPAEIVEWQADAVIVRLPVMLVVKPMPAELLLARADGTPAQPVAFELAMAEPR